MNEVEYAHSAIPRGVQSHIRGMCGSSLRLYLAIWEENNGGTTATPRERLVSGFPSGVVVADLSTRHLARTTQLDVRSCQRGLRTLSLAGLIFKRLPAVGGRFSIVLNTFHSPPSEAVSDRSDGKQKK